MSFYEKIKNENIEIPEKYQMTASQIADVAANAPDKWELLVCVFRYGYMQGVKAERAGKAK